MIVQTQFQGTVASLPDILAVHSFEQTKPVLAKLVRCAVVLGVTGYNPQLVAADPKTGFMAV